MIPKASMQKEPMLYEGHETVNPAYYDGQLPYVMGVQAYQALRVNREMPQYADDLGWTYINQHFMTYWNQKYYIQYISGEFGEHDPFTKAFLIDSTDGIRWSHPIEAFPSYTLPSGEGAVMHHRMAFYTAPNGRLLTLGFYGLRPSPNDGSGIGRVVREVYQDGTLGPVYFIRYNRQNGWNEKNTAFPNYRSAKNPGFLEACEDLLADKLVTLQWYEEEQSNDGFYHMQGGKAFQYFTRADGATVGLWKGANAALSFDKGETWNEMQVCSTLPANGAKTWAQQTSDQRYVLIQNPVTENINRWPFALFTSDDGICFDRMLCVEGEAPPIRYSGNCKTPGFQYFRGIEQYEDKRKELPNDDLWIAQAMNKEDIWVYRIPVPIRFQEEKNVCDDFSNFQLGKFVPNWNIHCGQWTPVSISNIPGTAQQCLTLQDKDPYDAARAMRIFPATNKVRVSLKMLPAQDTNGWLEIELADRKGQRAAVLIFDNHRQIFACGKEMHCIGWYQKKRWYQIELQADVQEKSFTVTVNGEQSRQSFPFIESTNRLERLILRTGQYGGKAENARRGWEFHDIQLDQNRQIVNYKTQERHSDLPNAGIPCQEARYDIEFLRTEDLETLR